MDFENPEVKWRVTETKKKVKEFRKERASTKPAWLGEYKLQQRLQAPHPTDPPVATTLKENKSQ